MRQQVDEQLAFGFIRRFVVDAELFKAIRRESACITIAANRCASVFSEQIGELFAYSFGAEWRFPFSGPNWVTSWILELEALRPDVFRFQTVIRLCQPLLRTALLARQPCARQFFGNCPIPVDSRFCRAHPYTDKSRRRDSHSTLEGRTELERPFEWRSPGSASNTS
jgi:hypothetical protein